MWHVEFELQEPASERRAIDPAAVAACFRRDLGEYAGTPREYLEVEIPVLGASYAHGADWAKEQDWTEIVTLRTDVAPWRLVAYERMQRLPWPQMVARLDARILRYPPGTGTPEGDTMRTLHDGTGIGNVVDGYLTQPATGFVLVGRARADLFSECANGIEKGEMVSAFIAALESQIRYCTVDDLFGSGHPPDGFVALALAYRAARVVPPARPRVGTWGR